MGFKVAAEAGDAIAQFFVGGAFNMGKGVPVDYEQARVWYEKAAAQGHTSSVSSLGRLAQYGRGQPPSYRRARELFQQAIDMGNENAVKSLQELTEVITEVRCSSLSSSATPTIPC